MHPELVRKLSLPSKVASILDWKKTFHHTVLAVNFHKNRVGIAVASHPSLGVPCLELKPLRFDIEDHNGNRKNIAGAIDRECLERFSDIIEDYKVCGVVVNWPLQRDTGRMGAACGRVIFALEQLWQRSNETITAKTATDAHTHDLNTTINTTQHHEPRGLLSRPFCLWDAGHIDLADPSKRIDAFGRCASYGKQEPSSSSATQTPSPPSETPPNEAMFTTDRYYNKGTNYLASKQQYHEDERTVVLGVWDDFCREHWPDLCATTVAKHEVEAEREHEHENTDRRSRYSDLGSPTKTPSRLQAIPKDKKSLVRMR